MICIAIPSRGRPHFVTRLINSAFGKANKIENVVVKYYLNDDDPDLEKYLMFLEPLKKQYKKSVQWIIGPDQNTILSWNEICENTKADYYMLAGDEVIFETQDWDIKLDYTKADYPDGVFCMAMYCGRESRFQKKQATTPVVTKQWRQALGYFWAPMFWHWQVDTWTGELAKTVNRFVYRRDIIVRITKLKDKTGMRNRNKGTFKRDEWTYKKCKEVYFQDDVARLKRAIK